MNKDVNHEDTSKYTDELRSLIVGMRAEYAKGNNVMQFARAQNFTPVNTSQAILISYDLQAGTYVEEVRNFPVEHELWTKQISEILIPLIKPNNSILEVGVGEATTLSGVLSHLDKQPVVALGFDISFSRIYTAMNYVTENSQKAELFVADIGKIPIMSDSIDIVYTSHSLEPNRGREKELIEELLRISKKYVVLIEPIYELASDEAKSRMDAHGYVKDLYNAAEECGAKVREYKLLDYAKNPLNPSGLIILEKTQDSNKNDSNSVQPDQTNTASQIQWMCPLTGTKLVKHNEYFISNETGIIYPIIKGIPLLRPEHAIVASVLIDNFD